MFASTNDARKSLSIPTHTNDADKLVTKSVPTNPVKSANSLKVEIKIG